MLIRELFESDYLDFYECLEELSSVTIDVDEFNTFFDKRRTFCITFVAIINDKVVGTASLLIEPKFSNNYKFCGHLEDVAVNKDYQGFGVAKALIEHIINHCKKKNYYKLILDCDKSLVKFYEKFGFKENGVAMRLDI